MAHLDILRWAVSNTAHDSIGRSTAVDGRGRPPRRRDLRLWIAAAPRRCGRRGHRCVLRLWCLKTHVLPLASTSSSSRCSRSGRSLQSAAPLTAPPGTRAWASEAAGCIRACAAHVVYHDYLTTSRTCPEPELRSTPIAAVVARTSTALAPSPAPWLVTRMACHQDQTSR